MNQNLAVLLWQLCYSKISFAVLVPERKLLLASDAAEAFESGNGFLEPAAAVDEVIVGAAVTEVACFGNDI